MRATRAAIPWIVAAMAGALIYACGRLGDDGSPSIDGGAVDSLDESTTATDAASSDTGVEVLTDSGAIADSAIADSILPDASPDIGYDPTDFYCKEADWPPRHDSCPCSPFSPCYEWQIGKVCEYSNWCPSRRYRMSCKWFYPKEGAPYTKQDGIVLTCDDGGVSDAADAAG